MTRKPPCEILLAEDSAADVVLVREALKEHGVDCTLHVVKDGAQAIAFINGLDPLGNGARLDLLLLDMHLPKHDGDDVLKSLRAAPRFAQTPVVVMTAVDALWLRPDVASDGALHFFGKPATLAQFMELGRIVKGLLAGNRPGAGETPGVAQ